MSTTTRTRMTSIAAFFVAVSCSTAALASFFQIAAAGVLRGAQVLNIAAVPPVAALADKFLELQTQACGIGIAFFGLSSLLIGYLIAASDEARA